MADAILPTWALGPFGAVVHDGRVCLLVRAKDHRARYAGTSRIGLATSDDGLHFK
jgi:predicted GH43/DUF377 family glycosyl hydrolase